MNVFLYRATALAALGFFTASLTAQAQTGSAAVERVTIDANAPATPFPHFWENTFGSGRAILSLRQDYRNDMRTVKAATGFGAVRFHGILDDEVGVYDPDRKSIQFAQMTGPGQPVSPGAGEYNFSYVDQIYDGLLDLGVRPYVELSFMPRKMSSDPASSQPFWYHPNVAPPEDYAKWDAMITALAQHLVQRYGIDEVSQWKFEVWNEPNLDFWAGSPKQPTYFMLYDHTARALKALSPRIQVGGPATAQAAWVGDFLKHCKDNNVPVDFASTHVYANDTAKDVFHTDENIPRDKMVCRAVRKVHEEIVNSPLPQVPLYFSEYNASYANEPDVTDTAYMGPWLAGTISQCDGLIQDMSYWTFSDVFEEQGVVRTPFYGGFGIIAEDSIRKPAFNAFAMLHGLGNQRIRVGSEDVLATRGGSDAVAVALWNYAPPDGTGAVYTPQPASRPEKTFDLHFRNVPPGSAITMERVDDEHGSVIKAYDAMGRPATPSREQIKQLRAAGMAAPAEHLQLVNGSVSIRVPQHGLVVLHVAGN